MNIQQNTQIPKLKFGEIFLYEIIVHSMANPIKKIEGRSGG